MIEGITLTDYQVEAQEHARSMTGNQRLCLYYKTGAGKTITSLVCMAEWEQDFVVVVTPPATYDAWEEWGRRFGIEVVTMSHAKFRAKDTRLSRSVPIIVDEFHLLGGHGGKGWKKMDTLARHLQAPLVICSATPNYNDAERVYCIQHVLDPQSCKGGYLEFLYRHCNTEQNPFGREPLVDKEQPFVNFKDAAEYLASLPNVLYLPDDLVYTIKDVVIPTRLPGEFDQYGYNARKDRIMASIIEAKHAVVDLNLIDDDGLLQGGVVDELLWIMDKVPGPTLVFAQHSTVAEALNRALPKWRRWKIGLVTGDTPAKKKAARIQAFRDGVLDVLIGTATLATGTDGLDKVCDQLIILDDTDDASLRRQLIGRIMPRGLDTDASKKSVHRLVLK